MKQCPVCGEGLLSREEDIRTETIGGKGCEIPSCIGCVIPVE